MKTTAKRFAPLMAAVAFGGMIGSVLYQAPLCHRPSMLLDSAEMQYCDLRDSADAGARGHGYPAFGKRTGLDLRLADTGNYQILYIAGQHQMEDTARRVATMLGANGGYLDARGNFVGAVGQWSLSAAKLIDGPVRDADPGTVALLLQKPSNN